MYASRDNKIFEVPDNASLSTKYLKWSLDKQRLLLWYLKRWNAFDGYDNVFELSDNPTFSLCQLLLNERRHLYYWKGSEERKIRMYLVSKAARSGFGYYEACRGEIVRNIKNELFDYIPYLYYPTMEKDRYGHTVDAKKPLPVQAYAFDDFFGLHPNLYFQKEKVLFFIEGQPELAFSLADANADFLFCDVYDKGDIEKNYFYDQLQHYFWCFNIDEKNAKIKRDYFVKNETCDDINKDFALIHVKKYNTRR